MFASDDGIYCPVTDHLLFTTLQDALQNNILPQYRLNHFHHLFSQHHKMGKSL